MLTAFRQFVTDKISADALLASVDFRRYWISSILTSFAGQIGALAMPLCAILLLHATPAQMGVLTAWQAIPFAVLALPAGVWLDRRRKKPILLCSRAVHALALVSIPVAWWLNLLSIPWMYAVAAVHGCCSVVGGGAEIIFLTFIVGRERMMDAQAKFAATDSVSRLVAPGLAGILIQWLTAPWAIILTACGFILSGANLGLVKASEPTPQPSDQHPLREIHDGLIFIWRLPILRTLAWAAGFWHLLFYGYSALLVLFATRELGMSAGMLGTAQMLGGFGVMASSILMKPLNSRFGPGKTVLIGIGATALGFVLMPTIPATLFGSANASAIAYGALVFFFDCGVMLFFIPYLSLRQKVTPDAYLGRMISTMRFLTVATAPLGALAAGYVADHYSVRTGLACVAAGGIALTAALLCSKSLREVRP
jgi:predicted MFS family arabinose efflux permease